MSDQLPPKFRSIDASITAQRDGKGFDLFIGIMAQGNSQAELAYLAGTVHAALMTMGHMPVCRFSPDEEKGGAA